MKKEIEILLKFQETRDITLEKYHMIAGIKEKNNHYVEYKARLREFIDNKERTAIKLNDEMTEA